MLSFDTILSPRAISFDITTFQSLQIEPILLDWEGDKFEILAYLLGEIPANSTEATSCSPVIPHAQMQRIRDNVVREYGTLRNAYSNVGTSLDARGLVFQYNAVFSAMEGGNYCYYQTDQHLVDDILNSGRGANITLQNAGVQYAANFESKLNPMRGTFSQLQQAANSATNDIGPSLNAYKQFWALNFDFHLYNGLSGRLDQLISEYTQLTSSSNSVFNQGNARVQGNFEAEARTNNVIYSAFLTAHNIWDTQDGDQGYGAFYDQITPFRNSLVLLSRFVVLDTPLNQQIFAEVNLHTSEVQKLWTSFPNYPKAMATTGFILDPQTSSRRFYARQLVLNTAEAAGAHFFRAIAPGESLIGTGFSYQHGGKMHPHSEHKDGRDCDLFSIYFKVGGPHYNEKKATDMVVFLLSVGVTRLIYTNTAVVTAANKAYPSNAVAVPGSGHKTHLHFDMDHATFETMQIA